jgi:hypothetical protein
MQHIENRRYWQTYSNRSKIRWGRTLLSFLIAVMFRYALYFGIKCFPRIGISSDNNIELNTMFIFADISLEIL